MLLETDACVMLALFLGWALAWGSEGELPLHAAPAHSIKAPATRFLAILFTLILFIKNLPKKGPFCVPDYRE
ncbi:MAG TPA: hypothetical protein DD400_00100 [Rhodospirillaceae bacterium]|nr:hypothetical protein [Rhodospirillaceae bacterium]